MGDTELQVRVVAAMSSGEGAEETTKDASDIAAFIKTGEPENEVGKVGLSSTESCSLWSSYMRDIVPVRVVCFGGSDSEGYGRALPKKFITIIIIGLNNK